MTTGGAPGVRATFFGTSSVYLTDGRSGVFVDAFLSRPSLLRVALGRVAPDARRITSALERGGVDVLDAVVVAHSHHDHAMDAPDVVRRLGGALYGSESTGNVARGAGLPEAQMHLIADGDRLTFGEFSVDVLEGMHSPGNRYPGTIDAPLTTPAKASAYKDGGCFSFLVSHPTGSVFIHPSPNFIPDKFAGLQADVLYLGVGGLSKQSQQFREDYWHHTVEALRPRLLVPIHWDDFGRPLTRALRPLPRFIDKFADTRAWIQRKSTHGGPAVRWLGALETIDLFV